MPRALTAMIDLQSCLLDVVAEDVKGVGVFSGGFNELAAFATPSECNDCIDLEDVGVQAENRSRKRKIWSRGMGGRDKKRVPASGARERFFIKDRAEARTNITHGRPSCMA